MSEIIRQAEYYRRGSGITLKALYWPARRDQHGNIIAWKLVSEYGLLCGSGKTQAEALADFERKINQAVAAGVDGRVVARRKNG